VCLRGCRTTESEQWAGRANMYYGRAGGLNSLPLQGIFGALDSLKQVGCCSSRRLSIAPCCGLRHQTDTCVPWLACRYGCPCSNAHTKELLEGFTSTCYIVNAVPPSAMHLLVFVLYREAASRAAVRSSPSRCRGRCQWSWVARTKTAHEV
jgi:hypothetical protein